MKQRTEERKVTAELLGKVHISDNNKHAIR